MHFILPDDKQGGKITSLVSNIIQYGKVQRKLNRCLPSTVGSFSNSYSYNLARETRQSSFLD